jgi:hypothetical protein
MPQKTHTASCATAATSMGDDRKRSNSAGGSRNQPNPIQNRDSAATAKRFGNSGDNAAYRDSQLSPSTAPWEPRFYEAARDEAFENSDNRNGRQRSFGHLRNTLISAACAALAAC